MNKISYLKCLLLPLHLTSSNTAHLSKEEINYVAFIRSNMQKSFRAKVVSILDFNLDHMSDHLNSNDDKVPPINYGGWIFGNKTIYFYTLPKTNAEFGNSAFMLQAGEYRHSWFTFGYKSYNVNMQGFCNHRYQPYSYTRVVEDKHPTRPLIMFFLYKSVCVRCNDTKISSNFRWKTHFEFKWHSLKQIKCGMYKWHTKPYLSLRSNLISYGFNLWWLNFYISFSLYKGEKYESLSTN